MDVQDLVLQWIFYRSFEFRPHITTYFIQFLAEILKKYAGAPLFLEAEKNLIISSSFQLYLTCSKYVDANYFFQLFQLVLSQTGCLAFLAVLEWHCRENKIIEEFHMEHIFEMALIVTKFIQPQEVPRVSQFVQILQNFCYSNMNQTGPTLKAIQILATFYKKNPEAIIRTFPNRDDKVLAAVKRLGDTAASSDVSPTSVNKNYGSRSQTPVNQPTKNEIIVEPERDPEDMSHNGSQDENVDQNFMVLKGQMDSFLNNFLRADDAVCLKYLQIVNDWLNEPRMEPLLVANANDIIGNLVKFFQRICAKVDVNRVKTYITVLETIRQIADSDHILKGLCETATFELFDTMLFIFVSASEVKASCKDNSVEQAGLSKMAGLLNETILRIIANGDLNQVYQTLFDLLIKCRSEYVPDKFDGLVVKCIVKITQRFEDHDEDIDLEGLYRKMHYYMVLVKVKRLDKKADHGVTIIKTVLTVLINKFDEAKVLQAYNSIANNEDDDASMKKMDLRYPAKEEGKSRRWGSTYRHSQRPSSPQELNRATVSANITTKRHPEMRQQEEPDDDDDDQQQHEEQKMDQLKEVTDKFRQKGLSVAHLPKILKELITVLKGFDEEIDIEPLVRGLDDKPRMYILREVKNFYSGNRAHDWSETKSQSRFSHSEYKGNNRMPSNDKSVDERPTPTKFTTSLRPTASSTQFSNHPQASKSSTNAFQKQHTGGSNLSPNMTKKPHQPQDEHVQKIDEIRKRMGFNNK